MHIVVIEDNVDAARWLTVFLEQEGHHVTVVSHDFDRVRDREFWADKDVAIVDLLLGTEITGADILGWMCKEEPRKYRIAFSAVADRDVVTEVKELANEVFTKGRDGIPALSMALERAAHRGRAHGG